MKKTKLPVLAGFGWGIIMLALLLCIQNTQSLQAASTYVTNQAVDVTQKAGGAVFVSRADQSGGTYTCKIVMTKNGKETTIAQNTEAAFVTNGKILYYSKKGKPADKNSYQYKNTIYSYNVKTGKRTKIITGTRYIACNCSGTYLYCGTDNDADGVDLYALNLKTKKKKHMTDVVGKVRVSGSRVVTDTNSGALGNYPIYSFKLDGSGKKKIADGGLMSFKNGKIYYYVCDEKTFDKFKVYQCTATGKNKKALTGWTASLPKKYMD